PFVTLNCAAIPPNLLDSEVFGHRAGALPGALRDKQGAADRADGGTLFLDQVCEMAPELQRKFLRFLQSGLIYPLGASEPRKIDLRIICASNRDPAEEVRLGRFREDLYYRLHVVPIHMPPLRDRGADIQDLADEALAQFSREEDSPFHTIAAGARRFLSAQPWPGNVRQMRNTIRNAVVLNSGPVLTRAMLPDHLAGFDTPPIVPDRAPADPDADAATLEALMGRSLAEIERMVIEETIARHGGSLPRAADALGVAPSTLYRKRAQWQDAVTQADS
ncbi:UNVERIFIED_CONTAM: hypothetical protein GTU68_025239, partial [Idotea baltica]|nr:hypothetical protein [Idotea baltica]